MTEPQSGTTGDGRSAGAPYGPATAQIRRFLVRLAALDAETRAAVVTRFAKAARSRAFAAADAALAETVERSGRADAQAALAGPLMQLVRRGAPANADGPKAVMDGVDEDGEGEGEELDALAEPALAALLALLVRDLLAPPHFAALYEAFSDAVPLASLD